MASTFAQRLDFLMRLTNTQNSMLARTLNFDASYISRIRSGRRGMPRHQPFVEPAAAYFAANLTEPYQRKAVADAICRGHEWPEDERVAATLVVSWLRGDKDDHDPIEQFLDDLSVLSSHAKAAETDACAQPLPASVTPTTENVALFYGDEGKREAVLSLLVEMAALKQPVELLFLSDEQLSWLHEDATFERQWSDLLMRVVSQGGKVSIVHATGRNLDQMLKTVEGWLPLYATGHVESWRYPKSRQGVRRRTLFVARGHAAIVSSSIGDHTEGMLNILLHDRRATEALEQEYNNYLALCQPLMNFDLLGDEAGVVRWAREAAHTVRDGSTEVMLRDAEDDEFGLLVRADEAATLFRTTVPAMVVAVEEPSFIAALWDYLNRTESVHRGRVPVAQRLEALAATLA